MPSLNPPEILERLRKIESDLWGRAEEFHDGTMHSSKGGVAFYFTSCAERLAKMQDKCADDLAAGSDLFFYRLLLPVREEFKRCAETAVGKKRLSPQEVNGMLSHQAFAIARVTLEVAEHLADKHQPWLARFKRHVAEGRHGVLPAVRAYAA